MPMRERLAVHRQPDLQAGQFCADLAQSFVILIGTKIPLRAPDEVMIPTLLAEEYSLTALNDLICP